MPAPASLLAPLPAFEQPTAADARNLKTARAYGDRVGRAAPLDVDGLRLGQAVSEALAATGASTLRRGQEAAVEVSYVLVNRQGAAHTAGTWCPWGGCAFCVGILP